MPCRAVPYRATPSNHCYSGHQFVQYHPHLTQWPMLLPQSSRLFVNSNFPLKFPRGLKENSNLLKARAPVQGGKTTRGSERELCVLYSAKQCSRKKGLKDAHGRQGWVCSTPISVREKTTTPSPSPSPSSPPTNIQQQQHTTNNNNGTDTFAETALSHIGQKPQTAAENNWNTQTGRAVFYLLD